MSDQKANHLAPEADLVPSLQEVVMRASLNAQKLTVAFEANAQGAIRILARNRVVVCDGNKMTPWDAPPLRELFRGNRMPPPDMDHYPPEYVWYFYLVEYQLLTVCRACGDRTDQEMEEIYSNLRRRPDGRSTGLVHDVMWQVLALLLGSYPLGEAEYAALTGQLARSARKWSQRPVSRNYVTYLRQTIGEKE